MLTDLANLADLIQTDELPLPNRNSVYVTLGPFVAPGALIGYLHLHDCYAAPTT